MVRTGHDEMSSAKGNYKWRWSHVDESETRDGYVALLNRLRPSDDPASYPSTTAWIDARSGERILEVGCGNGAVACAVARNTPDLVELVGIDNSAAMIEEAQGRLRGKDLPVIFSVADAHHLPFPDASFDRSYAMEVFVILPDPQRALAEMMRVTRPGGTVCLNESDCDTRAMVGSDPELTRRVMRYIGDHEFNGDAARNLVGWLKELGWAMNLVPTVGVMEGPSFLQSVLFPEFLEDAVQAGVVTEEESERFLADLHYREEHGLFFAYLVNFRIRAMKPGAEEYSRHGYR
jgi:SAM-dependent methyltransferase